MRLFCYSQVYLKTNDFHYFHLYLLYLCLQQCDSRVQGWVLLKYTVTLLYKQLQNRSSNYYMLYGKFWDFYCQNFPLQLCGSYDFSTKVSNSVHNWFLTEHVINFPVRFRKYPVLTMLKDHVLHQITEHFHEYQNKKHEINTSFVSLG